MVPKSPAVECVALFIFSSLVYIYFVNSNYFKTLICVLVLKRTVWKDIFEITYVGPSQVLIKPLDENQQPVIVRSQLGGEIDDVKIMGKDCYLVARTEDSLIIADLTKNLLSEVKFLIQHLNHFQQKTTPKNLNAVIIT